MRFAPNIQKHPFAFYVGLFFVLIFSYTLFAVISSFLPDRMVKHRVKMASNSLAAYGNYPRSVFDLETCQQDYFTESLILNQVYCIDRTKPLESAMKVRWKVVTKNLTGDLWQMTHEEVDFKECSYPRYWHGTTFLTRFLLLFFSYAQIQWLFFAVSLLLMLAFGRVYLPRAGVMKTVAFLMSWALVYGFMWMFSLQFTPVFIITLVSSILVVRYHCDVRRLGILFFVTGSLTCYFDLLTVPMLSLGWPLLVWLSLCEDNGPDIRSFWTVVKLALLWVAGFAFTWVMKWALASAVLGYNVFADAGKAMDKRTGVSEDFGRWDAIVKNAGMLPWLMILLTVLGFVACVFRRFRLPDWKQAGLYLLVAFAPYIWYLVLSNHSYVHFWFTYRLQAVSITAILLLVCSFRKRKPQISGR